MAKPRNSVLSHHNSQIHITCFSSCVDTELLLLACRIDCVSSRVLCGRGGGRNHFLLKLNLFRLHFRKNLHFQKRIYVYWRKILISEVSLNSSLFCPMSLFGIMQACLKVHRSWGGLSLKLPPKLKWFEAHVRALSRTCAKMGKIFTRECNGHFSACEWEDNTFLRFFSRTCFSVSVNPSHTTKPNRSVCLLVNVGYSRKFEQSEGIARIVIKTKRFSTFEHQNTARICQIILTVCLEPRAEWGGKQLLTDLSAG